MFITPAFACGAPRQPGCDIFYDSVGTASNSGNTFFAWLIVILVVMFLLAKK